MLLRTDLTRPGKPKWTQSIYFSSNYIPTLSIARRYCYFKCDRKDRSVFNDKKGGDVALYIKISLNSVECGLLNAKSCLV